MPRPLRPTDDGLVYHAGSIIRGRGSFFLAGVWLCGRIGGMPRRARSIVGGYAYHVLNRANGRLLGTPEERALLAESPVPLGWSWCDHVNQPQNEREARPLYLRPRVSAIFQTYRYPRKSELCSLAGLHKKMRSP